MYTVPAQCAQALLAVSVPPCQPQRKYPGALLGDAERVASSPATNTAALRLMAFVHVTRRVT